MAAPMRPDAKARELDPLDDCGDHVECWQCGGEGVTYSCWEEYACLDPEEGCEECERRCDICKGAGGWKRPITPQQEDSRG